MSTPTSQQLGDNPLLQNADLPLFDRIQAEHVVPAVRAVLSEAQKAVQALEQNPGTTFLDVMGPLFRIDEMLHRVWHPCSHLLQVKNTPELRQAYETVQPEVVTFHLKLAQSEPIYHAIKALKTGDAWQNLTSVQQRMVDLYLKDTELMGIGLSGTARDTFNQLTQELSQLETQFQNNLLDATRSFQMVLTTRDEIAGLPQSCLELASQSYNRNFPDGPRSSIDLGPWLFTLDVPSFQPFVENSTRRDLREKIYRAYITRASDGAHNNSPLITRILQIRQEKAKLLGYNSFAELSLTRKMAPSVKAVDELEQGLLQAAFPVAEEEMKELVALARNSGFNDEMMQWDISYWAKRLQESKFQYSDEDLRPYFPLPHVLAGLFSLVDRLFGIKVQAADGQAPVWHEDVRFFHVKDETGAHIASFYLDPYSRPANKRGGAWMDTCVTGHNWDGHKQIPVAHLVCNSTPPVGDKPSLLTFREVETLFHEFGHGLQHMLTTVPYPSVSGVNGVEWDAVEVASQFMENWLYHKPTLDQVSAHLDTGAPLPDDLFKKLDQSKTFRTGAMTLRQVSFGLMDMELHHRFDPYSETSPFTVQHRISEATSVLKPLPEDRFLCSFSHLFSGAYAAGYYSYKWAEVMSADCFAAFEEVGLDNVEAVAQVGRRYRDTILALGGSVPPSEVFKSFRGRDPDLKALLRHSGLVSNAS